ncbi:MAG: hypothetical protein JNL23_00370 [Chitinophagaceae bacterium]|nr:hypothetical protein [Chitinophagaceae bacterium]
MDESFSFTVTYNNKARDFEGLFQPYGYSYRISVDIDNATIFYERDEERNFRAILSPDAGEKIVDRNLVAAIGTRLEELFSD